MTKIDPEKFATAYLNLYALSPTAQREIPNVDNALLQYTEAVEAAKKFNREQPPPKTKLVKKNFWYLTITS